MLKFVVEYVTLCITLALAMAVSVPLMALAFYVARCL